MPPPKPLAHISPSQIKTFGSCPTKWWAEKRLGLRSPSTEATRFGGVLHAVAECHLIPVPEEEHLDYIYKTTKSDTDPAPSRADIGRAWGLLKHNISLGLLPAPGEGAVEGEVEKVLPSRVKLKGRFDHLGVIVDPETGVLCPVVTDHKTTSSPNYAETEETLRTNVQTIVYGYHGLESMPLAPRVCVRFVYYQTKQRKHGWRVEVWLTREEIGRGWMGLDEKAREMLAWYNEDDIEKIPRIVSEDSCRAFYRDCPARRVCPAHKPKQQSFLDSVVQDARNQAVMAKPQESTMSDVFAPRNAQVVNAFLKNPAKQAEEGYSAEQAAVLLAEYNNKEGWALDPSVQSKTKVIEIIRAGIAIVRARDVKAASNKAAVSAVVTTPPVVATRQLTEDELGLVEMLATAYSFPEEIAMGLVRTRPAMAQQVADEGIAYEVWADENDQPDMTPEREAPAAPALRATKTPAAKPPAATKAKAAPEPEPEPEVEEDAGTGGFSATAAVARAMQVDATLIKGLATTLKPKNLTIEQGLLALVDSYGGKALSGAELKEAIKGSLAIERVRETHINAVFLLLGQGGDTLQVPTRDGQDPVVADFDPLAYLKANYPALASDGALQAAVESLDTPEDVVEAVNVHIKRANSSGKAPPLRTRAEAAALSVPADEPARTPQQKPVPAPAPKPEPEPAPVDEVVPGDEGLFVLVDSILVDGSAVSLDAIYDDMVRNYIVAFGVHPDGVKYNEGRAAVALEFRKASAEAMAAGGWFSVRSSGAAYAALNGTFDGAVVIAGMR